MPSKERQSVDQRKNPSVLAEASVQDLICSDRVLSFSSPQLMGVLNITPDSFSDGGRLFDGGAVRLDAVRTQAQAMVAAGASVLDIGGESSRPGALAVSPQEEQRRVLPVLEALDDLDVVLSVDTYHADTVRAAIDAGAGMINDITGGSDAAVVKAVADSDVAYALMHMQGSPQTMQQHPTYEDVVAEIASYLTKRVRDCECAGISADRLIVDPGFGFGKSLGHNLALLRQLPEVRVGNSPILVGLSRKSMIGTITGQPVDKRLSGSLATVLLAAQNGANLIRVHDVEESADVLSVFQAYSSL